MKTTPPASFKDELSAKEKLWIEGVQSRIDKLEYFGAIEGHPRTSGPRRLLLRQMAQKIFKERFRFFWELAAEDPRFPDFGAIDLNGLLWLTNPGEERPAEAVIAAIYLFGPDDYDLTWLSEKFEDFIRSSWFDYLLN